MSNTDFSKIKGQTPISVIVHGGSYFGYLLSKTLLEQGSQVIIIDKYSSSTKNFFSELKNSGKVNFIDFKGLKSFYEKISRIDYLYYLLDENIIDKKNIESKDFLAESDYLNSSLTTSQKYKAKIALVTSLKLNRELANRVNHGNMSQPSPYSSLELQRYCENLAAEFVDKTKADLRIVRLGTLVGKGIKHINEQSLDRLFTDATQKNQIEIWGEGLEVHNVINESDAIYGILKLMFSENTKGEVISLCNKNDYTTLSLAYKLLELDVESKAIRFVEKTELESILQDLYVPAPNASQFGWKQKISLEESIVDQLHSYYERTDNKWNIVKSNEKVQSEKPLTTTKATRLGSIFEKILKPFKDMSDSKNFFSSINYSLLVKWIVGICASILLLYFLISPLIGVTLGSYLVYRNSSTLYNSLQTLDFEKIQDQTENISTNIDRLESNFGRLYWVFKLTGSKNFYNNTAQILQGSKYAVESAQDLVLGLEPLGQYFKDFEPAVNFDDTTQSSSREYREYLQAIDDNRYSISEGIYKMTLAQTLIDSVDTKNMPKFLQDYILQYKELINTTSNTVRPLENITQFLPDLLGVDERKRYLILLQNDGEIRGTGGWISSYAVVGLEGGQVRELFIDDIYNADGTLKVQGNSYKTPTSMTMALENTPYTFSLVNWNPNLDNVMLSSEQFIYDLGKGNDLDGVITIDTTFLQKLLEKWGGIEVPGESEIVTGDNLYTKIFEMHTEFTPGSTRKSTFLANLANATVTKFLSSDFTEYKDVLDVLSESLDEKHLQATFKNTLAKGFFDENNWDGNLDTKYQTSPISIDWNWGGNKANMYIKKNYSLSIDIKEESIVDYTYQIAVQNDSTENTYPQGDYTNYMRIFLPSNAQVKSIKGFKGNKYNTYYENGFKVVGGWFNTSIKDNNNFEITYRISRINDNYFPVKKDDYNYSLDVNIYKQPGSRKDAYNLTVSYPEDWILGLSEGLSSIGNQLNRRFDLAQDQTFIITWQK